MGVNNNSRSSTSQISNSSGGILGIAIEFERGMMAVCTSNGLVQVFSLSHLLSFTMNNTPNMTRNDHHDSRGPYSKGILLWSSQNITTSAIRCIVFGPKNTNALMYGGYDKMIILVDIDQWTITRELNVQGTVRFDEQRDINIVASPCLCSMYFNFFHCQNFQTGQYRAIRQAISLYRSWMSRQNIDAF